MLIRGAAGWLLMAVVLSASTGWATPIWNESLDGDLSSVAGAPTALSIGLGSSTITGSVSAGGGDTRDFITFTIGSGQQLAGLLLQQWEDGTVGGPANTGFHAINLGATSFVPGPATIGSFLGAAHIDFAPAGTDLLPGLGAGGLGALGFTAPLGAGTYSYVIQQTGGQLNRYALEFIVTPEPSTAVLLALGLGGLAMRRRC